MQSLIQSMRVQGLFDKYDYEVVLGEIDAAEGDRLRLLFGRNGSGKSTMLRLLFHALSGAPDRGHLQALTRLPFTEFRVQLSSGWVAIARRADDELDVVWLDIAVNTGEHEGQYRVGIDAEGRLHREQVQGHLRPLEQIIWDLGVFPVILTDSRQIVSDLLPDTARSTKRSSARYEVFAPGPSTVDELVNEQRDADLSRAIQQVERYLAQLTLAGSQAGSGRIDTIYAEVADGIVDNPVPRGRPAQWILPALERRISRLGDRAEP